MHGYLENQQKSNKILYVFVSKNIFTKNPFYQKSIFNKNKYL